MTLTPGTGTPLTMAPEYRPPPHPAPPDLSSLYRRWKDSTYEPWQYRLAIMATWLERRDLGAANPDTTALLG